MKSKEKINELALKIAKLFNEYEVSTDTRIYYNNLCIQDGDIKNIISNIKASDYTDYANNDTITITFEGVLYDILNNYEQYEDFTEKFDKLLEDYKFYYEFGEAWNIALYNI